MAMMKEAIEAGPPAQNPAANQIPATSQNLTPRNERPPVVQPGQSPVVDAAREPPVDLGEEDMYPWESAASGEEQEEYANAMEAMSKVVYEEDGTFDGLMGMIENDDPVSGLIKAAATVVTEVDKKIDIPEAVIPALPRSAFGMLYEAAVKGGSMEELSEQDELTAISATQDMVMQAYGMGTEDFQNMTNDLSESNVGELEGLYNQAVQGDGFSKKSS